MQSNEFDTYLSLLGKLLRLTDAQRKGLTDELRDHLESRTEDLVAAGVSPEAAIHQALDELGDVAGLAHQFLFVSRLQKRRRIMKWSFGTAAVVGTIFCLLTFGRNDQPGAPNGSPLIAQEKAKPAPVDPFGEPSGAKPAGQQIFELNPVTPAKKAAKEPDSVDTLGERIEREFNRPATFSFVGASLEDIAEDIRNRHKIEIQIDKKALEEASFDSATRFDKQMNGVRLRTALDLLLRDQGLGYQNYDGVLLITTKEKANDNLTRKVYPRKGIFDLTEARQVYSILVTTIHPDTWRSSGGNGALNILPDRIIVSNTDAVHRELEAFWKQNDAVDGSYSGQRKGDTFTEADIASLMQIGGSFGGGGRSKTPAPPREYGAAQR